MATRPNQALERTAPRGVFTFQMIKTVSVEVERNQPLRQADLDRDYGSLTGVLRQNPGFLGIWDFSPGDERR